MNPPEDAPLPWRQDEDFPAEIIDAKGVTIGEFFEHDKAAYAVAAANALPGLVETCKVLAKLDDDCQAIRSDGFAVTLYGVIKQARAVLAALPKGVRPS